MVSHLFIIEPNRRTFVKSFFEKIQTFPFRKFLAHIHLCKIHARQMCYTIC